MNLMKIVCADTNKADQAAQQIETNGYRAVVVGRAVITDHINDNQLAKIIARNGYTAEITEFDVEAWSKSK